MADEAVLVYQIALPISYTVDNTTGIEKGAVLKLSDPMTAAAVAANDDMVAGIAASEKIANDGKIKLGVYREGFFKMVMSGNVTAGDPVACVAGMNRVYSVVGSLTLSGSRILGVAKETAANGETALVELRPSFGFVAV